MNAANSNRLLQHIHRLAGDPPSTSDGELLRRYRDAGDQAAFTALMRRHGPMVHAVCQSVLRQRDDAEDAFQAAFLILAQKAASIRQQDELGGWLQRVAYRVALRARANALRRQKCEAQAARSPVAEPNCDDLSWGELKSILHAELAALPEQFRAPLVLCHLEGLTQEEAARRLGMTAATVKGRLQRGREKLRQRLERRGVALTAALAAALTGQALAETATQTIRNFTTATATTSATALAHGFLHSWMSMKLALFSAMLFSVGVIAGGIALRSPQPQREKPPLAEAKPAEKQPEARPPVDAHGDPLPDGAVARLGTIRFNHGDGLNSLFFSPDGKTIYSEGGGSIRLWDADNGKERHRIRTTKTPFPDAATVLLADGKTILSLQEGGQADVVRTWDLARRKETRALPLPVKRRVFSVDHRNVLTPDGKLAAMHVHTPAQVLVFDVETGKNLYQLAKGEKEFLAIAFAGNDRLVSADQKQRLEVWEARTGKLVRQIKHNAPIRYLLASPDGRWLASLQQRPSPYGRLVKQESVDLWDMRNGTVKHSLRAKAGYWFTNICFASDGKSLLTSSRCSVDGDEVILWDCETGRRILEFDKASGINADVAVISPDGSRLAAGDRAGKFELWNLKNGHRPTSEDSRHTRDAAVLLSPTGERATLIGQKSISSWDAGTGRYLHSFDLPRDTLYSRSHSADDRYAETFRIEGEELHILVWDIAARKCLHTLRFPGGYQQISAAFAPDASLLATWHPGKHTLIRLWDVRNGKLVRSFQEKKAGWPGRMDFSADGKALFVAGKQVVGYEVSSGKELFAWRLKPPLNPLAPRSAAVGGTPESEDDRIGWGTLAVSSDGTSIAATPWPGSAIRGSKEDAIALYHAQTGKLLRRCNDPSTTINSLKQLAFSADGQLLASSEGEMVHLWEVATGQLIATFKGHQGSIASLAFSANGQRLASASGDSTVLIWDATGSLGRVKTNATLEESWKALAGDDAKRAHQAVWALARTPVKSIPFLKDRLHPVKGVNRELLDQLMKDLNSDSFDVREKATAKLVQLGELAAPTLRRTLQDKPTLEQRRRIEPILNDLEAKQPSGEALRSLRAVRVLEHIDTVEARRLLRQWAEGAEGAGLTRAAQAALTRLHRRSP